MPGRNYSSNSYRFGLNGQEKDDEIYGATGTSYTAEFWQYDPRIGRRWNLDPVDQISISNYAAFALNPIWFVDPKGDNPGWFVNDETGDVVHVPGVDDLSDFKGDIGDKSKYTHFATDEEFASAATTGLNLDYGGESFKKYEAKDVNTTFDAFGVSSKYALSTLQQYQYDEFVTTDLSLVVKFKQRKGCP